jgi:hypothetical protein
MKLFGSTLAKLTRETRVAVLMAWSGRLDCQLSRDARKAGSLHRRRNRHFAS